MNRIIPSGSLIRDQLDIYDPLGSYARPVGIVVGDLSFIGFANNEDLGWSILDGSSVLDSEVSPGAVYFDPIVTNPGYYSIRWYPDRLGIWLLSFTYAATGEEIIKSYEVIAPPGLNGQGLIAAFY